MDLMAARRRMVDCQVRPNDVTDLRIIEAMLDVPRELFVPQSLRPCAYLDQDINVSVPGNPGRYLLKPALLARLLQAAAIGGHDKVLVVGCASGYAAAIVAKLAQVVLATESDAALVSQAQNALRQIGIGAVPVKQAQAREGDAAGAPFDVIVLQGATQVGLETLHNQLRVGGRLVGVDATSPSERAIMMTRSESDFGTRILFDASAPTLPGLERPASFVF